MSLQIQTFRQLIPLLTPYLETSDQRQALMKSAFLGTPIFVRLSLDGPTKQFTSNLIRWLVDQPDVAPNTPALVRLMQRLPVSGPDEQHLVQELINVVRYELAQDTPQVKNKPRVFISYSRQDGETFGKDLKNRLMLEGLTLWRDREEMQGGIGWWNQIVQALEEVQFMVLVATPAAMNSNIVRKEWRLARQQGVCVYPVQVPGLPIDFESMPNWMRDAHFYDLDHEWNTFINHLKIPCEVPKVPFMAPDKPPNFVERPEHFNVLKQQLLDSNFANPVAITTALRGAGGFGKTTLAIALCHDEDVHTAFDEGVLWVTLGENPDIVSGLTKLYRALTGEHPGFIDAEEGANRLAEKLVDADVLMVVDDVWDTAHLQPFLRGGGRCARLVTTRFGNVALDAKAKKILEVDEMNASESVEMLIAGIDPPPADLSPLHQLAHRLGDWALMLELANGMLREELMEGSSFQDALAYVNKILDEEGISGIESATRAGRRKSAAGVLSASLKYLHDDEPERLLELSIFFEDRDVPLTSIQRLWGYSEANTRKLLRRFTRASFINFNLDRATVRMHNVIREVFLSWLEDERKVHQKLAYKYLYQDGFLPDQYAWEQIGYHLTQAGQSDVLFALLTKFQYLRTKLSLTDVNALIADCCLLEEEEEVIQLISSCLRISYPVRRDPDQLGNQLWGRLLPYASHHDVIARLLKEILQSDVALMLPQTDTLMSAGGTLNRRIQTHTGISHCVLSDDGTYLIVATVDGQIQVWNWDKCIQVVAFNTQHDGINCLAVCGGYILTGHDHGAVAVWNWNTGEVINQTRASDAQIVAVHLEDETALIGHRNGIIRSWDWRQTQNLQVVERFISALKHMQVMPERALFDLEDRSIFLFDRRSKEKKHFGNIRSGVADIMMHEKHIVVGTVEGDILLGNRHRHLADAVKVHRGRQDEKIVQVSVLDRRIAAAFSRVNQTIRVWDLSKRNPTITLEGHSDHISNLLMTKDLLFSSDHSGNICVWKLNGGPDKQTQRAKLRTVVAGDAEAGHLVSVLSNQVLQVTNLRGDVLNSILPHRAFDAVVIKGNWLVVGGRHTGIIEVWDWPKAERVFELVKHDGQVTDLIVAGNMFISSATDERIYVWSLLTGEPVEATRWFQNGHTTASHVLGNYMIAGSSKGFVRLARWRTNKIKFFQKLSDHPITAIFSNPHYAVVGAANGDIAVIEWRRQQKAWIADVHTDAVSTIAIFDQWLLTGSLDCSVRLFHIKERRCIGKFTADFPIVSILGYHLSANGPEVEVLDRGGNVHVLRMNPRLQRMMQRML